MQSQQIEVVQETLLNTTNTTIISVSSNNAESSVVKNATNELVPSNLTDSNFTNSNNFSILVTKNSTNTSNEFINVVTNSTDVNTLNNNSSLNVSNSTLI